jgi:hypothetical protein
VGLQSMRNHRYYFADERSEVCGALLAPVDSDISHPLRSSGSADQAFRVPGVPPASQTSGTIRTNDLSADCQQRRKSGCFDGVGIASTPRGTREGLRREVDVHSRRAQRNDFGKAVLRFRGQTCRERPQNGCHRRFCRFVCERVPSALRTCTTARLPRRRTRWNPCRSSFGSVRSPAADLAGGAALPVSSTRSRSLNHWASDFDFPCHTRRRRDRLSEFLESAQVPLDRLANVCLSFPKGCLQS